MPEYYVTVIKFMGASWRKPILIEAPSAKHAAFIALEDAGISDGEAKVWREDNTGDVESFTKEP